MSNATQPRTACVPISLETVVALLAEGRFELTTEAATQNGIDTTFAMSFGPDGYRREYRLAPGDRPDFVVDARIVVEVKQKRATATQVLRQLTRYAAYDQVEAIVLATGRAMNCPREINGKPIRVVDLGRAWL